MSTIPPCCAEAEEGVCPQHEQQQRVMRFQGLKRAPRSAVRVQGESGRARPVRDEEERP